MRRILHCSILPREARQTVLLLVSLHMDVCLIVPDDDDYDDDDDDVCESID